MLLDAVLLRAVRTWTTGRFFLELHVTDTCDDGVDFCSIFTAFFGLLFGVEALPINDCGDVDIHTLLAASQQQQQQHGVYPKRALSFCVCTVPWTLPHSP